MSRTRQILILELGVLVIILAVTLHGPISAVAVGAWIGFAARALISASRSAKKLPLPADRGDK